MIRMTGLVDLKPLREMETRIPQTTEDVTGGVENMEQDQPPKESEGPVDDHEGSMAKADLLSIHKKSGELYNMIAEDEELEGWVQAKITKAAEYITAVHNNMEYEKTKPTTIGNGEMAPADPMNERTIARLQALAGIAPLTENVMMDGSTNDIPVEESHTIEEWMGIMKEAGYKLEEGNFGKLVAGTALAGLAALGGKKLSTPPEPPVPQQIAPALPPTEDDFAPGSYIPPRVGGSGNDNTEYVHDYSVSDSENLRRRGIDPDTLYHDGADEYGDRIAGRKLEKQNRTPPPPMEESLDENIVSRLQQLAGLAPLYESVTHGGDTTAVEETALNEKAPTGWEATVKKMKRKRKIDNPWALAHWMQSRGYHPKGKKSKE